MQSQKKALSKSLKSAFMRAGATAIVLALIAFWMIGTYNQLVKMRQNVRESWAAIDTELRRRYDLIPNLVETVKGYASHEHDTLEDVIKARHAVFICDWFVSRIGIGCGIETSGRVFCQIFASDPLFPRLARLNCKGR